MKMAIEMKHKLKVTPDDIRAIIKWQSSVIEHIDTCLRIRKSLKAEELLGLIKAFDEAELVAIATGANRLLDRLLFNQNCYNGYDTLGEKKVVRSSKKVAREFRLFAGKGHPEYADWRRKYHTRDVAVD